jgi:hypothetical protein
VKIGNYDGLGDSLWAKVLIANVNNALAMAGSCRNKKNVLKLWSGGYY